MKHKSIQSKHFKCKCGRSYEIFCDQDLLDDYPPDKMNTRLVVKEVK